MNDKHGVTLIELLITLVIIFILASVALPLTKVSATRAKELELRQALRTMRTAIDNFRDDWARDQGILLGRLCGNNQISCKESTGITGYPKTLETLLGVELSGAEATIEEANPIRRYLRRIPRDPVTNSTDWGLRCHQDEPDTESWCGEDVFDVYTRSTRTAIDGTAYRDW